MALEPKTEAASLVAIVCCVMVSDAVLVWKLFEVVFQAQPVPW